MSSLYEERLERMYQECLDPEDSPFGLWINGLFSVVTWIAEDLQFQDQKELFFLLLERLLREGKVVLVVPVDIDNRDTKTRIQDGDDRIWDESVEFIIDYMRQTFPKEAKHEHDMVLNDYWYGTACPHIGWVEPGTGKLVFS